MAWVVLALSVYGLYWLSNVPEPTARQLARPDPVQRYGLFAVATFLFAVAGLGVWEALRGFEAQDEIADWTRTPCKVLHANVDANNVLYSNAQTAPGGDWTGWSPGGWSNAPPLRAIAASQQGGPRGAQLWGIDTSGQLRSTYQETPGGAWSAWSGAWNGASPGNLVSLAAAQQNDGKVRLWAADANKVLYSNAQTAPGGDWTGWSPAP